MQTWPQYQYHTYMVVRFAIHHYYRLHLLLMVKQLQHQECIHSTIHMLYALYKSTFYLLTYFTYLHVNTIRSSTEAAVNSTIFSCLTSWNSLIRPGLKKWIYVNGTLVEQNFLQARIPFCRPTRNVNVLNTKISCSYENNWETLCTFFRARPRASYPTLKYHKENFPTALTQWSLLLR